MGGNRKKAPITVRGPWFAMPLAFLRSRACASLSPQASKMLLDLCSQLGPNARGNGDLAAAPALLRPRGWSGKGTHAAVLQELLDARLIVTTRQGGRNRCSLFAITLWPMDCDFSKLDCGPGCYTTLDWQEDQSRALPPTPERPAEWSKALRSYRVARDGPKAIAKARKADLPSPATGERVARLPPPRGKVRRVA
jgi:hypothetical protein